MGQGLTRRRYGSGHPRSGSRARAPYPPRWALGENPSSQPERDLARKYKTAQNFRNWWLRISGTHMVFSCMVNSLVPDLITIVPEPRQIDGNQQVLAKWAQSDLPSLCGLYSLFAAIHHNSYDTGMTLQISVSGACDKQPKPRNLRGSQLASC